MSASVLRTQNSARMASPPTRWLNETNFSAAKLRSANCVLKKSATRAATLNEFKIHACSPGVNPRLGR